MTTDSTQSDLTEAGLLEAANDLLNQLTTTLNTFTDTVTDLAEHKLDPEAHPDIRDLIQAVVTGTAFLTQTDATTLVGTRITAHNEDSTAHADIQAAINSLATLVDQLTARLDVLDPQDPNDPTSALNAALQAIDDQYDPVIAAEMEAWEKARAAELDTVDAIAATINDLNLAKAAARYEVLKEFGYYA